METFYFEMKKEHNKKIIKLNPIRDDKHTLDADDTNISIISLASYFFVHDLALSLIQLCSLHHVSKYFRINEICIWL